MRRWLGRAALLAAVLGGAAGLGLAIDGQSSATPKPGSAKGGADRGATPPGTVIDFVLVLRQRERALDRYLEEVDNPSSPRYRHYLDAETLGRRFGITDRAMARLGRRLASAHIRVNVSYPQRTELDVSSTVAAASAFFGVRFRDHRDGAGRIYHAPDRQPPVPDEIARWVTDVAGLSSERRIQPLDVPTRSCGYPRSFLSSPCSGFSPNDIAAAYDVRPLHARGLKGQGQTVAIVSYGGFDDTDVRVFDRAYHIRGPAVAHVAVGTGRVVTRENCKERECGVLGEVNLDVDVVRAVAPKAKILNYEAHASASCCFSPLINRIVKDGRARTVTISYGLCDVPSDPYVAAQRRADNKAMRIARGRGITIFISSGDAGAYTCQRSDLANHRVTGTWPSDSPYAVSVGGTLLSVRKDGSYLEEAGWEYPMTNLGGGGGINHVDARPSWQRGRGVPAGRTRVFPDVAASGDIASGFLMVSGGTIQQGSGTSQASPFWAGAFALIRQFAQRRGAGKVGFLNPIAYGLAGGKPKFEPFHDVVRGGNRYYDARPGWDYSTGLGSPDVWNLARDVATFLRRR